MHEKSTFKFLKNNDCKHNNFCWRTIKAVDLCCVPSPPVSVPVEKIIPTVNRYFYVATGNINLTNGVTLPANLFSDDNGDLATEFELFNPNGYTNLYINGVMQASGIYAITPTSFVINPYNGTLSAGTPIIIESLGFTINGT